MGRGTAREPTGPEVLRRDATTSPLHAPVREHLETFLARFEAESGFAAAQRPYGRVTFCGRIQATNWFSGIRPWSADSKTAREIIKFVEDSDIVINFVGMLGGFQCFDESAMNLATGKQEPTVYVDVTGQLSVYVRGPHERHLKRSQARLPNMVAFDNRIATLHELGHAKQFIERPGWYRLMGDAQRKSAFREQIEDAAKKMWTPTPKPVAAHVGGGGDGVPPPPPPPHPIGAISRPTAPDFVGKRSKHAANQTWVVVIDRDNMARHAWPICDELGLPKRMNYTVLGV